MSIQLEFREPQFLQESWPVSMNIGCKGILYSSTATHTKSTGIRAGVEEKNPGKMDIGSPTQMSCHPQMSNS